MRQRAAGLWLLLAASGFAQTFSFQVSMPRAAEHMVHVTMRSDGLAGEFQDFKMPAWMPGYYRLIDYAKNVTDFRARDGAGHALEWEKVARNAWRVATGNAPAVVIDYDVTGTLVSRRRTTAAYGRSSTRRRDTPASCASSRLEAPRISAVSSRA